MHLPRIGAPLSSLGRTVQPAVCTSLMKTECASFKAAYPFLCLISSNNTVRVFSLLDSSSSCAVKCATRVKWYSIREFPGSTACLSIFTEDGVVSVLRIDSSRGKLTLSKVVSFACSPSLAPIDDFFAEHAYALLCTSKNSASYLYHVDIEERSLRVYDLADAFVNPKICLLGTVICILDLHGVYKFQEGLGGLVLLSFQRFPSPLLSYSKVASGFIVAVRSATGLLLIDSFKESEVALYDTVETSPTKRLCILNSLSLIAFDKDVSARIEIHSGASKTRAAIQMSRPISTKEHVFSAAVANGRILLFSYSGASKEITVDHVCDPSFPGNSHDFAADYKKELNECFALFKKHIEGVYSTCTALFLFLACSALLEKLGSFCNTELLKNHPERDPYAVQGLLVEGRHFEALKMALDLVVSASDVRPILAKIIPNSSLCLSLIRQLCVSLAVCPERKLEWLQELLLNSDFSDLRDRSLLKQLVDEAGKSLDTQVRDSSGSLQTRLKLCRKLLSKVM